MDLMKKGLGERSREHSLWRSGRKEISDVEEMPGRKEEERMVILGDGEGRRETNREVEMAVAMEED